MLVAALGVMALIGLITLPTAVASADQGRLSVLGGGPNIFGRNMAALAVACLYFGLNHARFRIICAGLAGAALIGLIGSGSRGGLAAFLAGSAALFLLDAACRRFVITRPLLVIGFLAVGGVALLVADVGIIAEIGTERIIEQTLEGGSLSFRDILFQWSWDFWLEAPIFGNGLGSFALVTDLEYPHNILMEFLCETGVVGLILFLMLLLGAGFRQFVGANPERGLILALIALFAVAAMASGDFVDSRFLFLFLLYPLVGAAAVRVRFSVEPARFQSPTWRR
jgi:O-antigen ligase